MLRLAVVISLAAACGGSPSSSPDGGDKGKDSGSGSGSAALYPIAVGNSWTFTVAAVGAGSVCDAGTYMQQVVSANPVGGRAAFQMTDFCTGISGTYDYATPGGDEVDFYYSGSWLTLVDPMLVDGHTWTYFNTSYAWKRESSVSVPAGTYSDCWTAVQQVSYTAYMTYCRGAGLVRSYSQDLAGNGWDAQLSALSLQ